jgi:hypothetical protein
MVTVSGAIVIFPPLCSNEYNASTLFLYVDIYL